VVLWFVVRRALERKGGVPVLRVATVIVAVRLPDLAVGGNGGRGEIAQDVRRQAAAGRRCCREGPPRGVMVIV